MNWSILSITFGFSVIGYIIGSLSMAIIATKLFKLGDIRTKGSGNAGATNILRNYGAKFGIVVFILDVMKTVVAMLIASSVGSNVLLPVVGIAVVFGHVFPVFFGFKGGKGAACLCGLFFAINWPIALIGALFFLAIVLSSRMVSLGSLLAPIITTILIAVLITQDTPFAHKWASPLVYREDWYVPIISLGVAHLLVIYRHKENLKRIIKGKERKLSSK